MFPAMDQTLNAEINNFYEDYISWISNIGYIVPVNQLIIVFGFILLTETNLFAWNTIMTIYFRLRGK
jgi:hypothetical protein